MTESESLDCVAVKRGTHRALAKALTRNSPPPQQARTLHRLAAQAPLWKELTKGPTKRPARAVRGRGKRRSTG